MFKKVTIMATILFLLILIVYLVNLNENNDSEELSLSPFIKCLLAEGVVIYGSSTCPACHQLEQEHGGYEKIRPIYLDCSGFGSERERERCQEEMKTVYVPEIQIKGELFEKWGSPENLAEATGCEVTLD